MFSSRRREVEDDLAPRLAEYEVARYGAPPNAAIRTQLSERCTLSTRPVKRHGETVSEAFDQWDKQARKLTSKAAAWLASGPWRWRSGTGSDGTNTPLT